MGFAHRLEKSAGSEVEQELSREKRPEASPVVSMAHPKSPSESPQITLPEGVKAAATDAIPQLEDWLTQLISGDFQTRWEISKTLKQHPTEVLGPLLSLLPQAQKDEELLWFIARLLGEIDHPEAVANLVKILQSATTIEMQSVAALALANRGRSALSALEQLLTQPEIRLLVVQVLSQIDAPEVVDLLMAVVNDADSVVRGAAIDALGGFADPRIAPILLLALDDHDGEVRRLALRAVGARAAHLPGVALDEAIAPMLHDMNARVVEQAIGALGRLDTSRGRAGLAQVISGNQWSLPLQLQAIRALGWSHSSDAVEQLIHQLDASMTLIAQDQIPQDHEPSPTQSNIAALNRAQEIAVVLGRLRSPQKLLLAAQALELRLPAMFRQGDGDLKRAAAMALGQLGQASSFDALCPYLLDPSPGLTFHIMAALRRLAPEDGRERLEAYANDSALTAAEADVMGAAIAEWG